MIMMGTDSQLIMRTEQLHTSALSSLGEHPTCDGFI